MNHRTPPLPSQPSALCNAYAPLLPLLHTDELPSEQSALVDMHVKQCGWCQGRLGQYDALHAALRRRYSPEAATVGFRVPTAAEIAALSEQPPTTAAPRGSPPPRSMARPPLPRAH